MPMWRNYLKTAVRSLWRNRLYSLINLLGLAVGLAASVMVLLWVQSELSFDSYHREADRTFRVTNSIRLGDGTMVWPNSSLILGETALREVPGINRVAVFRIPFESLVFRVGDEMVSEKGAAYVDSTWFEAFDYQFLLGDSKRVLDDPNNLILTETKARSWFGSAEAAMDKIVRLNSIDMVVRAVVRDNPVNSSFRYEVLMPIASGLRDPDVRRSEYGWNNYNYQLFFQLKPGVEPEKVAPQLTQIYRAYKEDSSVTASLIPLRDIRFSNDFKSDYLPKGNRSTVITLGLVGLLILVIASINYVNLTTALTSRRAMEIGIKKSSGREERACSRSSWASRRSSFYWPWDWPWG